MAASVSEPTRRDFLGRSFCACAAAVLGGAGWGAARYLVPAGSSASAAPVDAASREQLEAKGHLLVPFQGTAALVIVEQGRLRAFDARCTHAGCIVEWVPGEKKFKCPCHGGVFDAKGERVSGPPPRPLVPIPAFVRGSRVYLGE